MRIPNIDRAGRRQRFLAGAAMLLVAAAAAAWLLARRTAPAAMLLLALPLFLGFLGVLQARART